ncbi:uncharacterized protein LOC131144497 [Malania oleifera]|uniref:uncharacterized protein LOC131144497 n=1 Tax=Malania oleifera TaxID=397392 RepID=UPI0025AE6F68|nr:uncharacterized protein LOC131144497 [Malania oleifera]
MHPPSLHAGFFSSLKRVEKRLKLEDPSQSQENNQTLTESLSSPIYLPSDQLKPSSTRLQDSEPPGEFLSNSSEFTPIHEDPPQSKGVDCPQNTVSEANDLVIDDIERLIQLLGLSDCREEERERVGLVSKCNGGSGEPCHCDAGFYEKIVGVKGPKCVKEVERLEGWIKHFSTGGGCSGEEKREPLRLAHLLLGKAAFLSGNGCGFEGFEFPSTVQEFLQNDPPTDC